MGVFWEDLDVVVEFFGIKIFLNEFVVYIRFVGFIDNRKKMNGLRIISVSVI